MVTLYGISNCDTVRKARNWLDKHAVEYRFHDFRKDGITPDIISAWLQHMPSERLINKRSTTWRGLSNADKSRAESQTVQVLMQYPTLIKRPVLETDNQPVELGFKAARYAQVLGKI